MRIRIPALRSWIWAFLVAFVVGASALLDNSLSRAEEQLLKVRGRVSDIDWVGSKVMIKWFTSYGDPNNDEMTFYVPHRAILRKGSSVIGLSELNVSDKVEIVYSNDPVNGNKAESITVSYKETR